MLKVTYSTHYTSTKFYVGHYWSLMADLLMSGGGELMTPCKEFDLTNAGIFLSSEGKSFSSDELESA